MDGDLDYPVTLSSRVTGADIMITLMSVSRPQEHEASLKELWLLFARIPGPGPCFGE